MTFTVDLCFFFATISYISVFVCFVFWRFLSFIFPHSYLPESQNKNKYVCCMFENSISKVQGEKVDIWAVDIPHKGQNN